MRSLNSLSLLTLFISAMTSPASRADDDVHALSGAATSGEAASASSAASSVGAGTGANATSAQKPGCLAQLTKFCSKLYDPAHQGNMDLTSGGTVMPLRFGKRPNNLPDSFYANEEAKLQAKNKLPPELVAKLNSLHYFDTLKAMLDEKKPIDQMTVAERSAYQRQIDTLGTDWTSTVQEVVDERLHELHPKEFSAEVVSPEILSEQYALTNKFKSQIYAAIWQGTPQWKKIEDDFDAGKAEYIAMLQQMPSLPDDVRKDWIARISSVNLISPGSDPLYADDACANTEVNAYYNSRKNYLTVCAGLFNSSEALATMMHELSHSLGIGRTIYKITNASSLAANFKKVRDELCSMKKQKSCPKSYAAFKRNMGSDLKALSSFQPQLPNFLRCLQYNIVRPSTPQDIDRLSALSTHGDFGHLADENNFLQISKPETVLPNGKETVNPTFLDPCGRPSWNEADYNLDNVDTVNFIFSAEYLCAPAGVPDGPRFDGAITNAEIEMRRLNAALISLGGPLSKAQEMAQAGYAEDSEERFADAMGLRVFARLVKKTPSASDRVQLANANLSLFCETPSLAKKYPTQAQLEKRHSLEPHSSGQKRQQELLVPDLRDAIGCQKDWDTKDCNPS